MQRSISDAMARQFIHTTWSFRADFRPRRVERDTILRPRFPCDRRTSRRAGVETTTISSAGSTLVVDRLQADVIELLDGRRSVRDCQERLAESYEMSDEYDNLVLSELDRLRTIGLLEWVG